MRQPIKNYLDKIQKHLEHISIPLISELTNIINGDWGLAKLNDVESVFLIDIEVSTDCYRLILYPMDKNSIQLGYKMLLQEYSEGLLNNNELNPNYDLYDFSNEYDNNELNLFDSAKKEIFIRWFTACWNKTNSKKLKKPIYLMFHDSSNSLDLNTNRWINDEIKWNSFN